MKSLNKIYISVIAVMTVMMSLTECSDDNDGMSGPPIIESVRFTDPEKADSTFTMASPGTMIAIMGRNLGGARELYINDQSVSFNLNMNTDHSLIAVIPTEENGFKLTIWNPELPNEIRLVTSHGEARFEFKVLSPRPEIDRIVAPYPRKTGDHLTVYGVNFLEIERIYFSDVDPYPEVLYDDNGNPIYVAIPKGNEVDAMGYEITKLDRYLDKKKKVYVTDSEMDLVVPDIPYMNGYLVIETPQGGASYDFSKLPPKPKMTGISSDMPVAGSTVTIKGEYFVFMKGIRIGDKLVVPADKINVSEDERELSFIMPEKPVKTTTISVETESGESNQFDFYNYETVLINFDDMGFNEGWDPSAKHADPATADIEPYVSDGRFALFDARNTASNFWGMMAFWRQYEDYSPFTMPSFDIIPAETPASEVYLKYECYTKNPYTKILRTCVFDTDDNEHVWVNWSDATQDLVEPELMGAFGEQIVGQWYTVYVPMDKFGVFKGKTYADIVTTPLNRVRFQLTNYTDKMEKVYLCIDNVRVGLKQTEISVLK